VSTNDALWARLTEAQQAAALAAVATGSPSANGNGEQHATAVATGAPQFSTWGDVAAVLGPITWTWPGWLPDGMLSIVAAEPGIGKSALCLRLAATLIGNVAEWPDGALHSAAPGRVVWAESESGQAINLERARGWGLDTSRILSPGLPLEDFQLDDAAKYQALRDLAFLNDVHAVVVDSLRGAHSRRENDSDLFAIVKLLAELARDCGKPVILTHHLRKRGLLDTDGPTLDRLRGSSAIVQPARVVWALDTPDLQDKDTRRLSQVKNNLGRSPAPLGFTIGPAGVTFVEAPEPPRVISRQEAAIQFLLTLLKEEALPAEEVLEQARLAGHSQTTVQRAKGKIGVISLKKGAGGGPWFWGLPEKN
jgi:putative DNA primase/helicase